MRSESMESVMDGQYTPIDDAAAAQWRDAGWWEGRTIRSLLTDAATRFADRVALVGRRSDGQRVQRTYREFDERASHAANVFASLGVNPGDAVVLMLPNWVEYAEMIYGINELGAIYAGIPVAYGELQAAAILRRSRAKILVVPRRWRSNENLELARRLLASIVTLERIIVVDEDDTGLMEGESLWTSHSDVIPHGYCSPDSGRVCYLGFTSGTTGEPKGAMHSHDTLIYAARRQAEQVGEAAYGDPIVQLIAAPMGHHTGYEFGAVFTVLMGGTGVYVDRWDAEWGVQVIREEKTTAFFGAPAFLQDLLRTDLVNDPGMMRIYVITGSSIPRGLPEHARRALGAYICPAWGMTECSIITTCTPRASEETTLTDGHVYKGSSIRVLDENGDVAPPGVVGDLVIRGPGVAYGYFDRPDATATAYLDGLWFSSGDRASIDAHGWVSLSGRTKDIVIRGGENIPVTEIESILFDHPDIHNVAVIGYPDERLGERVCAVIVPAAGSDTLTVDSLAAYLLGRGMSKHYLPERVVIRDELPMTPTGKIQKFKLRETVRRSG